MLEGPYLCTEIDCMSQKKLEKVRSIAKCVYFAIFIWSRQRWGWDVHFVEWVNWACRWHHSHAKSGCITVRHEVGVQVCWALRERYSWNGFQSSQLSIEKRWWPPTRIKMKIYAPRQKIRRIKTFEHMGAGLRCPEEAPKIKCLRVCFEITRKRTTKNNVKTRRCALWRWISHFTSIHHTVMFLTQKWLSCKGSTKSTQRVCICILQTSLLWYQQKYPRDVPLSTSAIDTMVSALTIIAFSQACVTQ